MKKLVLACVASLSLMACDAKESSPTPEATQTETPLTDAEKVLVGERTTAVVAAKTMKEAIDASAMDDRYTEPMRKVVTDAYADKFKQAVLDAKTQAELEPLRKLAPNMETQLQFNSRWLELKDTAKPVQK